MRTLQYMVRVGDRISASRCHETVVKSYIGDRLPDPADSNIRPAPKRNGK